MEEPRNRNIWWTVLVVIIVAILAGSIFLFLHASSTEPSQNDDVHQEDNSDQPSNLAPDFSIPDLEGTLFQLADVRGRIAVIDFMATWCGPCRAAMPHLGAIWEQYGETIIMISVDIDPVESEETLQQYVNEFPHATWIWAKDRVNLAQSYQIIAIPTTVIIDQDGLIRFRHVGVVDASTMSQEIEQLLQ
jgi:thiol-disulfide isomerase/thioredoxin